MKTLTILLLLSTFALAQDVPHELKNLRELRYKKIDEIDEKYVRELKKLKIKFTKQGDLADALRIEDEIKLYGKTKPLLAKTIDIDSLDYQLSLDQYLIKNGHQYHGKVNVILMHPHNGGRPGSIDLSAHTKKNKGQIKFEARNYDGGDCILKITKGDKIIQQITMNQNAWQAFEINYDREDVKIEVHAGGNHGWYREHLYVYFPEVILDK